jgi:hypothetical protein
MAGFYTSGDSFHTYLIFHSVFGMVLESDVPIREKGFQVPVNRKARRPETGSLWW